MNVLRQHGKAAWVVPTYKNGRAMWRWVQQIAVPMVAAKLWDVSKTERTIISHRGGFFAIYSDDNIDAIRSESFDLVIIDEASRIKAESIDEAIMPTLADTDGSMINISTPRGRNWWYDQCMAAKVDQKEHAFFTAPSSDNPNPNIQRAAELARERVPQAVYEQEWLAQFTEDGITLFTIANIDRAEVGAFGEQPPIDDHEYVTHVDVGRRQDATVINTTDITVDPYQRVAHERLERLPYPLIQQRIEERARTYPGQLIIESNGIGDPLIENLNVRATPFLTTAKSKVQALQTFQMLLEQGRYKAIWTKQERKELIQYQWDDGNLTQDCVMSLAIGAQSFATQEPRLRWL